MVPTHGQMQRWLALRFRGWRERRAAFEHSCDSCKQDKPALWRARTCSVTPLAGVPKGCAWTLMQ
jgi:hypothetical protein